MQVVGDCRPAAWNLFNDHAKTFEAIIDLHAFEVSIEINSNFS
jgi:hypothetical protein